MHIMLDIETLGKRPGAPVKQIGYCLFDDRSSKIGPCETIHLDLQSVLDSGLTMDASTIQWWMRQSDEAREAMFKPGVNLAHGLEWLNNVYADRRPYETWANSPQFDVVLLETAYQVTGVKSPFEYHRVRDMRTLMMLVPDKELPEIEPEVKHEAGADAKAQALRVQRALMIMNEADLDVPALFKGIGGEF